MGLFLHMLRSPRPWSYTSRISLIKSLEVHPLINISLQVYSALSFSKKLIAPISLEEIKVVVSSSPNNFCYGLYQFTLNFIKVCRTLLGIHFIKLFFPFFFLACSLHCSIKTTCIFLIPKRPHVSNIIDFKLIYLCNTMYKIIVKILASRMKRMMAHIIYPSQVRFIYHRSSTNNVIISKEILSQFKGFKIEKAFCEKFDIKKAFDIIDKNFILNRFLVKGFHAIFITWIYACIMDVHFSICIILLLLQWN